MRQDMRGPVDLGHQRRERLLNLAFEVRRRSLVVFLQHEPIA